MIVASYSTQAASAVLVNSTIVSGYGTMASAYTRTGCPSFCQGSGDSNGETPVGSFLVLQQLQQLVMVLQLLQQCMLIVPHICLN